MTPFAFQGIEEGRGFHTIRWDTFCNAYIRPFLIAGLDSASYCYGLASGLR